MPWCIVAAMEGNQIFFNHLRNHFEVDQFFKNNKLHQYFYTCYGFKGLRPSFALNAFASSISMLS